MKRSIATRWFVNSFVVVAVVLAVMAVALFFMLRQYYYGAVGQLLQSEANIISGVLTRYYESFGVNDPNEIRRSIEEFDKKNRMELMAIDSKGRVLLTSSGFSPNENYNMPDFLAAKENPGRMGQHIGYFNDSEKYSEKYMAVTLMLPNWQNDDNTYSAIRLVTSLEDVDSQIYTFMLFVGILSIAILLLLLFLGLYFVSSIVSPLRQIGNTARRLSGGDFSVRIEQNKNQDEIGELCSVINDMADELENSEAMKNDFISSVSHELRTPLTAIKGWGETVLELKDAEITEKGMNVIIAETERLTLMVEELLDFSRIQNGSLNLQMSCIDIIEELSAAVTIYADRAAREKIELIYNRPEKSQFVYFVYGDRYRIRQVFLNIIDNAIKYSNNSTNSNNADKSKVTIETKADEAEIVIFVTDCGAGIPKADLPKVKSKFFKGNNTKRGAGIGLAVADEIVALHNGRLDIESEYGKGTTVKIALPLEQETKEYNAEQKTEEKSEQETEVLV